ncbi:MAG TPA: HAD-IIIC family phosphatase [Candidatus Limnocylindrales bacterium]|nr:HAD-IIIC family phosphatase [Candidatus Limnocylindrales bacterium]
MTTDPSSSPDARALFLGALEAGDLPAATRAARSLLGQTPAGAAASMIRRTVGKTPADRLPLVPVKVALLSSFSIEFVHDALIALAFAEGLRVEVYQAGFGQFRQEILDAGSGLYAFAPDVAVLALEGKDVAPAVYAPDAADGAPEAAAAEVGQELSRLARTFRERSAATLLVHTFAPPTWRRLGILDGHAGAGQADLVAGMNAALAALCRDTASMYAVDYAGLVQRAGALAWYDDRMEQYARAPVAQALLPRLAAEYVKYLRAVTGKARKCLVLDLDNTLWGGIVGEDGPRGIKLGPEYPGCAYVAFQHAVRGLKQRGVILAVASKNNPADVDEVFAGNPHMVLGREDFSVLRIGWGAKSRSIAEIARHLNIGLEHVVFADDSQAECDEVAHALPTVTVLSLPAAPEGLVRALLEPGFFDGLSVSAEDRRRGELYQQRDQAEDLRAESASLEDFYRRLEMEVIFAPVGPASLTRAAQLTQKTNQFNVTTTRYSEAEMRERQADPEWLVSTVQVRDRFGDNGIVGVMMARTRAQELLIDTLLLSCRVIGRTVETAMLAHLSEHAAGRGATRVRGRIIPTAKNEPARDLYDRHGFRRAAGGEDTESQWVLDLDRQGVAYPEWLKIVSEGRPAS